MRANHVEPVVLPAWGGLEVQPPLKWLARLIRFKRGGCKDYIDCID
jgi:hypothetical protein